MDLNEMKARLEAVLFAYAEPLTPERLAEILDAEVPVVEKVLQTLSDELQKPSRGVELIRLENAWQLATKPACGDVVKTALDTRRNELRAMEISTDRARIASLEPGISLGRFSTEEAAERHLATMAKKGVSGAKVVVERPETTNYTVRFPKLDAATKKRVQTWHVMEGKDLQTCQP